jgi:hypothetical protein
MIRSWKLSREDKTINLTPKNITMIHRTATVASNAKELLHDYEISIGGGFIKNFEKKRLI